MTNFRTIKKNGKKRAVPIHTGTRSRGRSRDISTNEMREYTITELDRDLNSQNQVVENTDASYTIYGERLGTVSDEPENRSPYSVWYSADVYRTDDGKYVVKYSHHALYNSTELLHSKIVEYDSRKEAKEYITKYFKNNDRSEMVYDINEFFKKKQ